MLLILIPTIYNCKEFDNIQGAVVILRNVQEYIETWVTMMQQFSDWEIAIEDHLEISIDGDLAVTTCSFAGGGRNKNG